MPLTPLDQYWRLIPSVDLLLAVHARLITIPVYSFIHLFQTDSLLHPSLLLRPWQQRGLLRIRGRFQRVFELPNPFNH